MRNETYNQNELGNEHIVFNYPIRYTYLNL